MTQVLDTYPPSHCPHCQRDTPYDGWGYGELSGNLVEFYCAVCGKVKARSPIDDISDEALLREIEQVFAEGTGEEVADA